MMCDGAFVSSIRRATSNPVSPGICTSRKTRSGCSLSIVVSASMPFPAWPITSTPPTCPSKYPSSSLASCSSSTRTARRSMLRGYPFRNRQQRYLDAGGCPLPGLARELDLAVRAVDGPQALVDVAQADAAAVGALEPVFDHVGAHAQPIVVDLDNRVAVPGGRADRDPSAADFSREPVFDRVLHERLQEHARHDDIQRIDADLLVDFQLRSEAHDFDVQILVDRFELFAQRDEVIGTAHQAA